MNITKTLYITKRKKWRQWLAKNHIKEKEIWLVYYRKDTGKQRISYDDAVLEALAFGWIDSTVKKIDDKRFVQRFSPRRPGSVLSQMNKERVRELIKEKQMTPHGLAAIAHAYDPKNDTKELFVIPAGITKALQSNKVAWKNFQRMPKSYQRIRISYIESRKRHGVALYAKALRHFIHKTEQGKRVGFVRERS